MHFGYTGLLNFGQAGFMLLGAYGYAIPAIMWNAPVIVSVLCGIGLSVVFALLLGIPTLRLRADYLAIVTIAAAEILRLIVTSTAMQDITGSANGLPSSAPTATAAQFVSARVTWMATSPNSISLPPMYPTASRTAGALTV